MKIASIILTIAGMFLNFYVIGPSWLSYVGLVIGIYMLITLFSDRKKTWLGVLGLIFTGLLGGIFYLCWQPENE